MKPSFHEFPGTTQVPWLNIVKCGGILLAVTVFSLIFDALGLSEANIIMLYLLGVLVTAVVTPHKIYSLVSAVASVLVFNFLFTSPRFSLMAYATDYPVTFLVMFLTAYITATLAIRYRDQARRSARDAQRTQILFETGQLLSQSQGRMAIFQAAGEQLRKLLNRDLVLFDLENGTLGKVQLFGVGETPQRFYGAQEIPAAKWALENNRPAGAALEQFGHVRYRYYPISVQNRVYGVLGIQAEDGPLDEFSHSILLSILGECAMALENEKNAREKEAAAILAESEQLRANLLRTISHDLRTPLTTISGSASSLLANGSTFDEATRRQMYQDIYDDAQWLAELVENILYATRIEEGRITLHTSTELLSDIVEEALSHLSRKAAGHELRTQYDDDLLLVDADPKLLVQVLINLVGNGLKYTPPGSVITVASRRKGAMAEIRVADNGPGIPVEDREHIFEKFYCGTRPVTDDRRSLGLGLFLCKAIVEAHGGQISAQANFPKGAVFVFTVPVKEVQIYA